jgi:DNA polymerase I-like protein with 3'-5' exonuclease and polymerase domains
LGGVKDAILAAGYDLERPTKEDVARIKKECKAERTIAKLCTLSISYGISAGGLMNNLVSSGFPTTYEQAEQMHADYWLLYSGVKDYECRLQKIWRENGGWVRNGVGRPIATHPDDVRKLLNKVIQSTAADIHILYVDILLRRLREAIPKYRWDPIILNFHDESILEVDEEYAEQVARIMDTDVYAELNERLGGEIPIRGGSMIVSNLADIKCE